MKRGGIPEFDGGLRPPKPEPHNSGFGAVMGSLTLPFTETDPLDAPAPTNPFTAALEAFDPEAEPYASMSIEELLTLRKACEKGNDRVRLWTAELHAAHRQPPLLRLVTLTQHATHGWLLEHERAGKLPHGWTPRYLYAVCTMIFASVHEAHAGKDLGGLTMKEYALYADDLGRRYALATIENPSRVEGFADERQIPLGDHPATLN